MQAARVPSHEELVVGYDRRHLIAGFSKHAEAYERHARVQSYLAEVLVRTWAEQEIDCLLDLGSGTGLCKQLLKSKPKMSIAIDLAPEMAFSARTHYSHSLIADSTQLPLGDSSCSHVVSNLMLQWLENPVLCFAEVRRVLRAGGRFRFTTLVPGSMNQLSQAFGERRVSHFFSKQQWLNWLDQEGFTVVSVSQFCLRESFVSSSKLLRSVRHIGAANHSHQRVSLNRKQYHESMTRLEQARTSWGVPLDYHVLLMECQV